MGVSIIFSVVQHCDIFEYCGFDALNAAIFRRVVGAYSEFVGAK